MEPVPRSTSGSSAADAAALDGATYESTSVTGRDLVEGSRIRLGFEERTMAVSAGCNTMFGAYAVADGTLAWTGAAASTMMACSPELEEQDRWLAELFTSGVAARLEGSRLTVTGGSVTIKLSRYVASPEDGSRARA